MPTYLYTPKLGYLSGRTFRITIEESATPLPPFEVARYSLDKPDNPAELAMLWKKYNGYYRTMDRKGYLAIEEVIINDDGTIESLGRVITKDSKGTCVFDKIAKRFIQQRIQNNNPPSNGVKALEEIFA